MSEIRENSKEIITKELIKNGFLMEMQAAYIEKVCEAASESNHPVFDQRIKLPQTKAQEIAAEMVLQYLQEKNMKRSLNSLLSESHQQFSRKHDDEWIQKETKSENSNKLLHELVDNWKSLDREISLHPSPEEEAALNKALGINNKQQQQPEAVKSRGMTFTTEDQTIVNDTIQTTGQGQGSKKPWKIPPKKPIRGRQKQQFVGPPAIMEGNGHKTVTVANGTITTGTITPTPDDSWSSTISEQPPVIQKIVKKVKKPRAKPEKVEQEVQVTLSDDSSTGPSYSSHHSKTKSQEPSEKHSYTTTYNTVNPATQGTQRTIPTTTYTYTYETVTVPRPDTTTSTKTGETIQSTDTFSHQFDAQKGRKTSTASSRKSSAKQSDASVSSHHKSKSRTSTRDTTNDEPLSRESRHSKSNTRTASRHSTRDGSEVDRFNSHSSTQRSQRKQAPPPSLPQPGSTSNYTSSSQDTMHKLMKQSPLGEILEMQEANGGILPQSQPTQSSGSTPNVSVHVMSQNGSKKGTQEQDSSSSDVPDLDSSTLGDVKSDDDKFKSDSISSEKMASDKELWSSKKHN